MRALEIAFLCLAAATLASAGYKRTKGQRVDDLVRTDTETEPAEPQTPEQEVETLLGALFGGAGLITELYRTRLALRKVALLLDQGVSEGAKYAGASDKVHLLLEQCESTEPATCGLRQLGKLRELAPLEEESVTLAMYVRDCKRRRLADCLEASVAETERKMAQMDELAVEMLDNLGDLMSTRKVRGAIEWEELPVDRYAHSVAGVMEDLAAESVLAAAKRWLGGKAAFEQEFQRVVLNSCRQVNALISPNLCLYEPDLLAREPALLQRAAPLIEWCAGGRHCAVIEANKEAIAAASFQIIKRRAPMIGLAD